MHRSPVFFFACTRRPDPAKNCSHTVFFINMGYIILYTTPWSCSNIRPEEIPFCCSCLGWDTLEMVRIHDSRITHVSSVILKVTRTRLYLSTPRVTGTSNGSRFRKGIYLEYAGYFFSPSHCCGRSRQSLPMRGSQKISHTYTYMHTYTPRHH